MIRVCNLCLEKLAIADDEDEDDRRSVVSATFPAHQLGQFADTFSSGRSPASPFAGPLGRVSRDEHLFHGIPSNSRFSFHERYGSDDGSSRPLSPYLIDGVETPWDIDHVIAHSKVVPFRRSLADEDGDPNSLANAGSLSQQEVPSSLPNKGIDIPSKPLNIDASVSSIQFPLGSPENETPSNDGRNKFSHPFYGDYEVGTPFIRSRVQSRLDSIQMGEPGWRTRRESTA